VVRWVFPFFCHSRGFMFEPASLIQRPPVYLIEDKNVSALILIMWQIVRLRLQTFQHLSVYYYVVTYCRLNIWYWSQSYLQPRYLKRGDNGEAYNPRSLHNIVFADSHGIFICFVYSTSNIGRAYVTADINTKNRCRTSAANSVSNSLCLTHSRSLLWWLSTRTH
jgi:hypothetical protein